MQGQKSKNIKENLLCIKVLLSQQQLNINTNKKLIRKLLFCYKIWLKCRNYN